ncbi:MAG TPA: hypothetical protein VEF33_09295, partial [Syntrophales bacterium]|nr:hypothetical protein [Syntrophales bacterium]
MALNSLRTHYNHWFVLCQVYIRLFKGGLKTATINLNLNKGRQSSLLFWNFLPVRVIKEKYGAAASPVQD